MKPRASSRLIGLAALALALSVAAGAAAQPTSGDLAIQKGREGVALYEQGEWGRALALFREADALYHSPVFVLYAARAQAHLGKLVDARALYLALAAERTDEDAPTSWKQAQVDGAAELKALEAAIPRLTVRVAPLSPAARLTIDGTSAAIGEPIAVDPGSHVVVVSEGTRSTRREVVTRVGEHPVVTLSLALREPPRPPPPQPVVEPVDGWFVLGVTATTVGGSALVAGAVLGGLALREANEAEEGLSARCDIEANTCPIDEREAIEDAYGSAYPLASAADGLLIGGGLSAAAGLIVLILDPGGDVVTVAPTASGSTLRFSF